MYINIYYVRINNNKDDKTERKKECEEKIVYQKQPKTNESLLLHFVFEHCLFTICWFH